MPDRTKITVDAPLYDEAKQLDAQLAAREGRLTNVSNYVRRALTEYNRQVAAQLDGVAAVEEGRVPLGRAAHPCVCRGVDTAHDAGIRGCIYGPGGTLDGKDPLADGTLR